MTAYSRNRATLRLLLRLATLCLFLLSPRIWAAFGVKESPKDYTVDTGAGLVFKVEKADGNIVSIHYKGGPELQESKKGSHIASGFGAASVTAAGIGSEYIKITLATSKTNVAVKNLTHYLIVRKGVNNIYMATYAAAEPAVGELRWITRLESAPFPNSPHPSNIRETNRPIESKDIFGCADGTTRSKYYGDVRGRGKDRAMDLTYCGVSGQGVGVWMVYGSRESSSGGPFHRDIQNQSSEVYNYMNSGHNQTESPRLNVLHGPYTLVFTDGRPPALPVDVAWIETAGFNLTGWVSAGQRGAVGGTAIGIAAGFQGVVGFSNPTAQYWATVAANGTYNCPRMKPGTYAAQLYKGELSVASATTTVTAGAVTMLNLAAESYPAFVFKIGEWDGMPAGFLNGDKIVTMHPSDRRMSPWSSSTYTVGTDSAARFPAIQFRKTNSPTTIHFNLTSAQIADHTLRIGITCSYNGGRPAIQLNNWSPKGIPDGSNQPKSRSFTIGTYRGNNTLFTYQIPASAFVEGRNVLTISAVSGSTDLGPWLSAGWVYDAIQLDAASAPAPEQRAK